MEVTGRRRIYCIGARRARRARRAASVPARDWAPWNLEPEGEPERESLEARPNRPARQATSPSSSERGKVPVAVNGTRLSIVAALFVAASACGAQPVAPARSHAARAKASGDSASER